MNKQRGASLKIMLRLWSLTLAVSLFGFQLTAAANTIPTVTDTDTDIATATTALNSTFQSTSIEADLNVLDEVETTASASTIHLRLHDNIDNVNGIQQTAMTSASVLTATTLHAQEPLTRESFSTISSTTTSSSMTTLASSNAPATITNQARETTLPSANQKETEEQQTGFVKDKSVATTTASTLTTTTTSHKNNDDELVEEIKEIATKQVTESVVASEEQQQQQQQITTDVNWQKETDMHKQFLPGNAEIKDNVDSSKAETETVTSTPSIAKTLTTVKPDVTHNENGDAITSTTTTPIKTHTTTVVLHGKQQKEITGDGDKSLKLFNPATTQPSSLQDSQAIEDFKPIIRDANEKLLKEHTIFSSPSNINKEEWKQNLMPNELEYEDHKPLITKNYEHNINWSPYLHPATPVTDFTGKLLQEQDGVITEIEQKFRLNEFVADNDAKTSSTEMPKTPASYSVNQKILFNKNTPILRSRPNVEFIERRVKKSFDFPMHRMASDAQHMQQHFDFANTKFKSNNNEPSTAQITNANTDGSLMDKSQPARPQPEFSTTKFYNSKELYNEMLQHKIKQPLQMPQLSKLTEKDLQELNNRQPSLALNSFAVLHSPKIAKLEEIHTGKDVPQQQQQQQLQQKSLAIKKVTVKSTKHKDLPTSVAEDKTTISTTTGYTTPYLNAIRSQTAPSSTSSPLKSFTLKATTTEIPSFASSAAEGEIKGKKFQKELKRAKLLIKSMMPLQYNATAAAVTTTTSKAITTTTINNSNNNNNIYNNPVLKANKDETTTNFLHQTQNIQQHTAAAASTSTTRPVTYPYAVAFPSTSTNSPKTSLHPIVRPRILSRLQEKINSLECELQNLPQDSHLWRGNETHELLLPIMICKPYWTPTSWFAYNKWVIRNPLNCTKATDTPENCKTDKDCTAMMVSWEGEAEIQSGDILIVEINDALLTPKDINLTTSAHNTQVYQVTRSGHEHCDVTEGILLDITPLIVDGRKLVTLYDKDLTEGVNLLIVVSELWGTQCVRLKVTTKTENCGENADCSGKGICYSNYDMEEYECQCCSGFAGPHCEEIDACTPSPCTNNGICVDLSQGHEGNSYQCLCPYGYTGKNCQYELDPCNPAECMNGGSCVGNSTHFRCDCTPGYTGPLCQHSLNECESSPCIHGICVDQEDGFRCFCQPGFAGELCNFEYNECESNPCQNGGECIDHIGSYECHCTKGYTGNRCQIKVDFCSNKPCPEGRRCIDHGNDYSCECLGGRNGPDCNEMQRTQCNVNPCTHGGTCWSSGDSFYCACRPGYTGTMCEDEFVVETVVSSSEFMVDDTSARNFNDKSFGSSVVLKSPIELHNAYTAAIVLALVIFFVALYLTICHCKVNQTYRKFSTRTYGFLPILGFRLRTKQATSKISRHWLSGKGLGIGNAMRGTSTTSSPTSASALHATTSSHRNSNAGHLPTAKASSASSAQHHQTHVGQLNERPFQRHLAMNLENDMYYTVDFSENSQHSPLIQ